MKPATGATVEFAGSNPFALALLGLETRIRTIDQALPRLDPQAASAAELHEPATHPLDLALLGLIALGERLGALGVGPNGEEAGIGEPARSAEPAGSPGELLR